MSLQNFEQDGLEFVIDTTTGETYATISGYARMSGKLFDTIAKRVRRGSKGLDKTQLKTAEVKTPAGFRSSTLIPKSIVSDWITKDNPDLARQIDHQPQGMGSSSMH